MMRVLYGGTFDPVHYGHLAIARAARDRLQCPVWLMPAADPPHRPVPGASAADRLRMLELAIQDEPGLCIDRRELDRPGPSYTVDTLRELRQEIGPQPALVLLLGADSFLSLPDWHDWQDLFNLTHLIVAGRCGSSLDGALADVLAKAACGRWSHTSDALMHTPAGRIMCLQQPLHPASATDIRQRLAHGARWAELLPSPVVRYIRKHGLYRSGQASMVSSG